MKSILWLLVLSVLAAQICARPGDDKEKVPKKAEEEAKGKANDVVDGMKKGAGTLKKDEDEAENDVKKGVKDCEETAAEAPKKPHPKPKRKGPISGTAEKFVDEICDFFGVFGI